MKDHLIAFLGDLNEPVLQKKGAGRSSKRKFDNENGDRKKSVKKGKKGKVKVFNTEGVGPNFKKGGGKEKLRGVKAGKISKKKRK